MDSPLGKGGRQPGCQPKVPLFLRLLRPNSAQASGHCESWICVTLAT